MKKKKKNIFKILFILFSMIIALFVVWSLGKPIYSPWPLSIQINEPKFATIDENGNLLGITDNNLTRASIIDENNQVEKSLSFPTFSPKDERYYNICCNNNKTYLLHVNYDIKSGYLESEEIQCYDEDNHTTGNIYSINYDPLQDQQDTPEILCISPYKDGIIFLKHSEKDSSKFQIYTFTNNKISLFKEHSINIKCNKIIDACYNPICDKIIYVSVEGSIYVIDKDGNNTICNTDSSSAFCSATLDDDGKIYAASILSSDLYRIENNFTKTIYRGIYANSLHYEHNNLILCEAKNDKVILFNKQDLDDAFEHDSLVENVRETSSIDYNWKLITNILVTWFCYLYIVVLLIIVIFRSVKNISKKLNRGTKIYINMGIILILAIVFISIFFTNNIYQQSENTRFDQLKTACSSFYDSNYDNFLIANDDSLSAEKQADAINKIYDNAHKLKASYAKGNTGIEFFVLMKKELETFKSQFASKEDNLPDNKVYAQHSVSEMIEENYSEMMQSSNNSEWGTILNNFLPVRDLSGNLISIIISTSAKKQIIETQVENGIKLFIMLFVTGCAISLFSIEILSLRKNLKTSVKIKRKKISGNTELYSVRILTFLNNFIYSLDIALLVLISKDMLQGTSLVENTTILSVPIVVFMIGDLIGTFSANWIVKKFTAYTVMIYSTILGLISEILEIYFMLSNNFFMFCVLKIGTGINSGLICFASQVIQYRTNDYKIQATIANDSALAIMSSSALATMFAGYLADAFGNFSIYAMAAILHVLILIAVNWFIPKGIFFSSKEKKQTSTKGSSSISNFLKLVFSPAMLIIILCTCFISCIAYQYNSILYPLLADEAGISKSLIGNITMISICVVFFINSMLKKTMSKTKQGVLVAIAMLLYSFSLLCFGLNDSIIWASLTLVIVAFSYRICSTSQKLIWVPLAKKSNVKEESLYLLMTQLKQFATSIAPIILTSLISFGNAQAAIIVGIVSAIGLALFCIITRKTEIF